MRRRKGLDRKRELRADPEKVRQFLKKHRGDLKRSKGSGLKSKPQPKREEGPLSPHEWRVAAFVASDGVCIITGARARNAEDRRFHAHHPFPARVLRGRGYWDRVWDPRNALWVHRDAHMRHEDAVERIPCEALPRSVWEFTAELDAIEGSEWATQLVLRAHPPAGHSRALSAEENQDGEGRAGHRCEGEGRGAERQEPGGA